MCLKSNETGAINFFLLKSEPQINIVPFKVVPFGSRTVPEKLLPLPVAVLEVFLWKCPQLVCHDLLDVVHISKMTDFEVKFEFREEEEVTRNQMRRVRGLWPHWNTLFGQKIRSRRWQCERKVRDTASKCPQSLAGHDETFLWVLQGPHDITLYLLTVCPWGTTSFWTLSVSLTFRHSSCVRLEGNFSQHLRPRRDFFTLSTEAPVPSKISIVFSPKDRYYEQNKWRHIQEGYNLHVPTPLPFALYFWMQYRNIVWLHDQQIVHVTCLLCLLFCMDETLGLWY